MTDKHALIEMKQMMLDSRWNKKITRGMVKDWKRRGGGMFNFIDIIEESNKVRINGVLFHFR